MVLAGVKSQPRTPTHGNINLVVSDFRESYEIMETPDVIKHLKAAYPA